jgi:hypothetical protein
MPWILLRAKAKKVREMLLLLLTCEDQIDRDLA